jgi:ankyrin repeat protein
MSEENLVQDLNDSFALVEKKDKTKSDYERIKQLLKTKKISYTLSFFLLTSRNLGDIKLVKLLLDYGQAHSVAWFSQAIAKSAENGYVEVVKLLLSDSRFDPSADNDEALVRSAENGHTEVVKLLLNDPRVSANTEDSFALRVSAENGHTEVVRLLLNDTSDTRADPSAEDNEALLLSAENGHTEVVRLLLNDTSNTRADPAAQESYALRWSADRAYPEIVKLLLVDGRADPAAQESYALRWSARYGHLEVVKLLLEDGRADPRAEESYALQWSAQNGHLEVVKLLLEDRRANPAASESHALRWSARHGHLEVVKLLLEDGRADPSNRRSEAIAWSSIQGRLETTRLLLKDGRANPFQTDSEWNILLQATLAKEIRNLLVAAFFIKFSAGKSDSAAALVNLHFKYDESSWQIQDTGVPFSSVFSEFKLLFQAYDNVFVEDKDQLNLGYLLQFSNKQLKMLKNRFKYLQNDQERKIKNTAFAYFFMIQYSLIQVEEGKLDSVYEDAETWSFAVAKEILLDQWLQTMGSNFDSKPLLTQEYEKLQEMDTETEQYKQALKRLARLMSISDTDDTNLLKKIEEKLFTKSKEKTLQELQPERKRAKLEKKAPPKPKMLPDWIDLNFKQKLKF